MSKLARIVLTFVLIVILSTSVYSEELVDKIAAVIGDEIILVSELDFQLQMFVMQMQKQDLSAEDADSFRILILDQMVSDKLMLVEAMKDTTIALSDAMVEDALVTKIEELRARFATETEFEEQMKLEGLSLRELKAKFRREVRNQLIKDRFVSQFLSKVNVTSTEVRDFYGRYGDSLPSQPEAMKVAHLLLAIEPSGATLDSAKAKAEKVKQLLDEGGDFVALAQLYSEDGSASSGGDLGYFEKGTLFKEFEDVAFNMGVGEISEPFKTRVGYHIVKIDDKLPDRLRARHILFKTNPNEDDTRRIIATADSLKQLIDEGNIDFTETVKIYSIDEETKKLGGDLGWFAVDKLTPEFREALFGLELGEISEPTKSEFGIHLLKLIDNQESRQMNLTDDWDRIKDFARREKSNVVLERWLEKAKHKIYVDVRL
jgi:peptidyl-prolyl cis-trans isomerase SurA